MELKAWTFIDFNISRQRADLYSQAEVFIELNMKIYYRNRNKNILTVDVKPDETMKEVATKVQDKGGLKPCHVSVTVVNNICNCGKRIEHLLLESLDNPIEIEIESELETENSMKDSFTYVNRLY